MRLRFVCAVALALAVIGQSDASRKDNALLAGTKPNMVFILSDDLDVGTFQNMLAAGLLPNINARLVQQGVVFDNNFVTNSLCCPSRATFLSGQYPHNNNVLSNTPSGGLLSFDDTTSLPTWLQTAGYYTGQVGKYLNGYGSDVNAATGTPSNPYYVPPGWNFWQGWIDAGLSTYTAFQFLVNVNGTRVDFARNGTASWNYTTDMISMLGASFLKQWATSYSAEPFFLWLTPISPHVHMTNRADGVFQNVCPAPYDGLKAPFNSPGSLFGMVPVPPARYAGTLAGRYTLPQPPSFNEDVSDKPAWLAARPPLTSSDVRCLQAQYTTRMEAMRAVDDQVGYIFQQLDSLGVTSSTVVFFASDNGYLKGEHRLTEKTWPYEESIRVPLVVHLPGQTTSRHVSAATLNNDLAPTIAYLAGATSTRVMDGVNLAGYLAGTIPQARLAFMVEQYPGGVDPAPTSFGGGDLPVLPGPTFTVRVMSPRPQMYTEYSTGETEFYNLVTDPYELSNAASDPANAMEISRLSTLLASLKTCSGATCRRLEFVGQ